MNTFGISVVGRDRPGIVADVTGALAEHDGNIEDSSMTLLQGHFAWILVVALPIDHDALDASLASIRSDELLVDVMELPVDRAAVAAPTHWLTVHGSDRPGIVSAVARAIAEVGGNITDLSTRLANSLYMVAADVTLPDTVDVSAFSQHLAAIGSELGVDVVLRVVDIDEGF